MSLLLCHPGTFAAVTGPALAGGRGGGDHDGGGVGGRRKTWRMEMGGSESVGGRSMPVVNCGAAGEVRGGRERRWGRGARLSTMKLGLKKRSPLHCLRLADSTS